MGQPATAVFMGSGFAAAQRPGMTTEGDHGRAGAFSAIPPIW